MSPLKLVQTIIIIFHNTCIKYMYCVSSPQCVPSLKQCFLLFQSCESIEVGSDDNASAAGRTTPSIKPPTRSSKETGHVVGCVRTVILDRNAVRTGCFLQLHLFTIVNYETFNI